MWRLVLFLLPSASFADSLVATRVIRAQEMVAADAVTLVEAEIPGAVTDPDQAIGQEVRVTIYPGRPVLAENVGPKAVVDRNQIVSLSYRIGGLTIQTEGRALMRGAAGDVIEVMNLASKTKVTGQIGLDGTIQVGLKTTP